MNLVKWFRKNNKKVMAIVVCIIMIGFIGGTYLQQLAKRQSGQWDTVAFYLDDIEIQRNDLMIAQRELEILRSLRAEQLLRSQDISRDITGALLAEVIFTDQQVSPQLMAALGRGIRQAGYRISEEQLAALYERKAPGNVYWLLLKNEARLAGVRIPSEEAGQLLGNIIPQAIPGATYSQYMNALITENALPEDAILEIFAQLLAVMQYAQVACTLQDVSVPQIRQIVSAEGETMDARIVRLSADVFAEDQNEPTPADIQTQFDKYKNTFAGEISEDNPYGFGYKLAERVQLDYLFVKIDDAAAAIEAPTQEDMEQYYQQHAQDFVDMVPIDPNDPNSITRTVTKPFAVIMDEIEETMRQTRTSILARDIIAEAATSTAPELSGTESDDATVDQLKEKAGDYKAVADKLAAENNVKIYTGTTGLLDVKDVQQDQYLRRLYIRGNAGTPVSLPRMAFAVEELKAGDLGPFTARRSRMYENIGPAIDVLTEIMGIVRVVDVREAAAPDSVDETFSIAGLQLGDPNDANDVFTVKEQVAKDCKGLAAMEITAARAAELRGLAKAEGFAQAVAQFNELYPKDPNAEDGEPNNFRIDTLNAMTRLTSQAMETIAAQNKGNAASGLVMRARNIEKLFAEKLYSLAPADSNGLEDPPVIMEFKPDVSYYCINNLTVRRVYQEDFSQVKAMRLFREEFAESQNLAPVHFAPENIAKRLKLRYLEDEQDEAEVDANEPAEE